MPWWAIGVGSFVLLVLALLLVGLLLRNKQGKLTVAQQTYLRNWLAQKDGDYLNSSMGGSIYERSRMDLNSDRYESWLLSIRGNIARYSVLRTSLTEKTGTWEVQFEGKLNDDVWQTPDGGKALSFDGTGLVKLNGVTYYKVPEPVDNNLELAIVNQVRTDILAGKKPIYELND